MPSGRRGQAMAIEPLPGREYELRAGRARPRGEAHAATRNSMLWSSFVVVFLFDAVAQTSIGTHYGASPPLPALGSPRVVHLANYALVGLSVLLVLQAFGTHSVRRSHGARICISSFLPFLAAWVIAAFLGAFPGAPRNAWTAWLAILALVLATASADDRLRAVRVLSRGAVALSLVAAVTSHSWAFAPYDAWTGGWRVGVPRLQGIFPQPNPLGWFAAFAVVVELAGYPIPRRRMLPIAGALTCVILSGSRTALFGLVVAFVIGLLAHKRLRTTARLAAWAVAGLGVWEVLRVLHDALRTGADTLNGRTLTWHIALNVWHANPLVGSGPGAYINHAATGEAVGYAHNQFLHTLAETGLLGAVALTWLTVVVIVFAWRMRRAAPYAALAATTLWIALYGTENVLRFTDVSFALPIAVFLLLLSSVDDQALRIAASPPLERTTYRAP